MSKPERSEDLIRKKLEEIAGLSNDEIVARSVVSGVIFIIIMTILDFVLSRPINLWQTITLGMIFSGILCAFDLLQRKAARRRLK